jgi:hypothetical protein
MGTNYYVLKNKPTLETPIHIGKSSCGWLFGFQEQNETWRDVPVVWHTYNQVKEWLKKYTTGENPQYVILNEYDEIISYEEFIDLVDEKQKDEKNLSNPDNFNYYVKNIDGYRFSEGDFS